VPVGPVLLLVWNSGTTIRGTGTVLVEVLVQHLATYSLTLLLLASTSQVLATEKVWSTDKSTTVCSLCCTSTSVSTVLLLPVLVLPGGTSTGSCTVVLVLV
jgi:hypothetical protein